MDPKIVSHEIIVSEKKKITVLKPIIDHVAMTLRGKSAIEVLTKNSKNNWKAIANSYWNGFFDLTDKLVEDKSTDFSPLKVRGVPYKRKTKVSVGPSQFVRLFTRPTKETIAPVRIEFNPSKLADGAFNTLAEKWQEIEYDNIPFPSLMPDARITRLDIAIDCLGISPTDIIVYNKGLWKSWNAAGLETGTQTSNHYLTSGKHKSPQLSPKKRANLVVYDKRQEQLDNDVNPIFGQRDHTRIEFSLNWNCRLKSLENRPYPFQDWYIRRTMVAEPPYENWIWQLVLDSARYRGTRQALELLPTELRNVALSPDKHAPADLISKTKTWCHWNEALSGSGLDQLIEWGSSDPADFIPVSGANWF